MDAQLDIRSPERDRGFGNNAKLFSGGVLPAHRDTGDPAAA
jgi:hypothetical protein